MFKAQQTRARSQERARGEGDWFGFLYIASPQQGDLRLSGPPSGLGAGGETRNRDRRFSADFRADSLTTVPSTPPRGGRGERVVFVGQ
ncbi:hypothetical protein PoB_004222500 [Plakobranchus ocellatus]|uniref:Uncharacterized protein n=1 Tax=Plakobranchus ocellatus TaxID=259542 RepID=A0AAV4B9F1_9GAST|nr:hypothetical protein PoB_004222500 [Plakobranchus ocellatus]